MSIFVSDHRCDIEQKPPKINLMVLDITVGINRFLI